MHETTHRAVMYRDGKSVFLPDGGLLYLTDAIDRLEWQPMLCPTMPHAYVVSTWTSLDRDAFDAILEMIRHSPATVLAYWRGYQSPTRYWHGPSGFRYWTTPGYKPGSLVLNRTDEVDDTRPVNQGGRAEIGWGGCPWEPRCSRVYERVAGLHGWWPSASALAAGYEPCRACQRRPAESWSDEERRLLGLAE